ncbi:MAG: ATPase, T2SS/T4P/T4SS family, partial [Patescibacteria group bacterium]
MSVIPKALLNDLIMTVVKEGASDLHLTEGRPPVIRVSGFLVPLVKMSMLSREDIQGLLSILLTPEGRREFEEKCETNFAYSHTNKERFRSNAFMTLGKASIAMRLVPTQAKSFEELNLPSILGVFAKKQQGFFLVVGPAGQGKSTTLATMIEAINKERLEHIITIEDPIEYV